MRSRAIAAFTALMGTVIVSAASESVPWLTTFGGEKDDLVFSAAIMPDGTYVVGAFTESKGAGKSDFWLIRFDHEGRVIWDKTFGGRNDDGPVKKAFVPLPDGGFAMVGTTYSKGAGASDAWVLRLDPQGNVLWDRTFGGRGEDAGFAIAAMPDGGFAVAAKSRSKGPGVAYAWVLRLDRDGRVQWEKTFPTDVIPREDLYELATLAALPDGGLVLGGRKKTDTSEDFDAWVLRIDAKGGVVWDKTYAGPNGERVDTILALPDGGVLAAGGSQTTELAYGMAWRLDRDGGLLWQKTFGAPLGWVIGSTLLPDGGFALAGFTATTVGSDKGGSVWRLDPSGRTVWQQTIDAPNPAFATAVDAFPDGRLLVAGVTKAKGQYDGGIAILPPTPATATASARAQTAAAPGAPQECLKYLPSIGRSVSVPCEPSDSSAPSAQLPAPAAPATAGPPPSR
jgi:hypothetical protein